MNLKYTKNHQTYKKRGFGQIYVGEVMAVKATVGESLLVMHFGSYLDFYSKYKKTKSQTIIGSEIGDTTRGLVIFS
jgi:hypothetical protein